MRAVLLQHLHAERMERPDGRPILLTGHDRLDAAGHFVGRLLGECQCEDAERLFRSFRKEFRDAGGFRTRVLPDPGPASTNSGPSTQFTAAVCASVSWVSAIDSSLMTASSIRL